MALLVTMVRVVVVVVIVMMRLDGIVVMGEILRCNSMRHRLILLLLLMVLLLLLLLYGRMLVFIDMRVDTLLTL